MKSFVQWYLERVAAVRSVLCIGLDPTPAHVPPQFGDGNDLKAVEHYLRHIIKIAVRLAAIIKPQVAYYEAMGPAGLEMMIRLIAYTHELGIPVILDAKRSDIGSTMERYGKTVFDIYGVDACTWVPYLGSVIFPAWVPWLAKGKCAISMVRTSNPEAAELQDELLADWTTDGDDHSPLYKRMALMVRDWEERVFQETGVENAVGGVIGATWPNQAVECRRLVGNNVFALIPGYGEQGGGAEGAVAGLPTSDGVLLGTVNSSRGITLTSWWDSKAKRPCNGDPLDLVVVAVNKANDELNVALKAKLGRDPYGVLVA